MSSNPFSLMYVPPTIDREMISCGYCSDPFSSSVETRERAPVQINPCGHFICYDCAKDAAESKEDSMPRCPKCDKAMVVQDCIIMGLEGLKFILMKQKEGVMNINTTPIKFKLPQPIHSPSLPPLSIRNHASQPTPKPVPQPKPTSALATAPAPITTHTQATTPTPTPNKSNKKTSRPEENGSDTEDEFIPPPDLAPRKKHRNLNTHKEATVIIIID
jgi:hypothetical protein